MPFDRFTALIFLLVSLTSHSLKMFRKGKIIIALCAVHSIVNGDKADAFLWENHLGIHSHLQVVSP